MSTKVVTGRVRMGYPNLFTPRADPNGRMKYSVLVLVPKSDKATIKRLQEAIKEAALAGFGDKVKLSALKVSLRDGDAEDKGPDYEGHYFFNASNKDKPGVIDGERQHILDPDQVTSGDWGRVSANAYSYDHPVGGKGVSFGLLNVQWLGEGDPIGNRSRAEDDFAEAWGKSDDAEEGDPW